MRTLPVLALLLGFAGSVAATAAAQDPIVVPVLPPIGVAPGSVVPFEPSSVTVTKTGPQQQQPQQPGTDATAPQDAIDPRYQREVVLEPRVRNVTRPHNSMPHHLVGVGVVTGLAGTGASDRGTRQAILNFVRQNGLNLVLADVVAGSTALVSLTCSLQPFGKAGQRLDVKCEILGDATSLRGGELLRAELRGVDGKTYVVAQGAVMVAGYTAQGANASVQKNLNTTGWVSNGGVVIREENTSYFGESGHLELQVLNPSPYNASSIAGGITAALAGTGLAARAIDPALVRIEVPLEQRTNEHAMRILVLVGDVRVRVENPAKVVVDQASGTVLAGEGVLISPCVVGLTDVTIAVVEDEEVSQPGPFSPGTSERVGRTRIEVQSDSSALKPLSSGATVSDLLQNLRTLGLTPSQLVAVFQALDQGNFLHAELEVR